MERMAAMLQISVENRQVAAPAPPVDQGTKPFNPLFASIRERHHTIDEGLLQEIFEKKIQASVAPFGSREASSSDLRRYRGRLLVFPLCMCEVFSVSVVPRFEVLPALSVLLEDIR
jgi:hypothetical protein